MTSRKHLLVLLAAAVLVMAAAWLAAYLRGTSPDEAVGTDLLPTLRTELNDVSAVRIVAAGDQPLVTLQRSQDKPNWQVAEREGYPADFSKVRELLLKLAELQVVEVKTANPENHSQLDVEDVSDPDAGGKRIEIDGLAAPVRLIVGKSTDGGALYVRRADEAGSYLAKPQIDLRGGPETWLERNLMDLPTERVQEVRVTLGDGPAAERQYSVTREVREQTDFTVPKLPRGRKLSYSGAANANAGALASLAFEDVRASKPEDANWGKGADRAEFRLFDGTIVVVHGRKAAAEGEGEGESENGDAKEVRFEVRFDESQYQRFAPKLAPQQEEPPKLTDPAEVRREVEALEGKLSGWLFELPSHKYTTIFRPLDELTEKG